VGRPALRQANSVPILNDIRPYLEPDQPKALPESPKAQVIRGPEIGRPLIGEKLRESSSVPRVFLCRKK
jgi:hypothetical protein